jgi:hypothetical protein
MRESGFPFWQTLVSGVGAVVLGTAALARPDLGVRAVTAIVGVQVLSWILAVAWILVGLGAAVLAGQLGRSEPIGRVGRMARIGFAAFAVAAVAFGAAFRVWPGMSAGALVILTGIGGVVVGLWLVAVAVQLHQLSHED